jgi:hypothetical protein
LGDAPYGDATGDMFCAPVFGTRSYDFDDGTAPRFHCYGSDDPDAESGDIGYSCEPYWLLKAETRRQKGAGWFLWLALQESGAERDQLFDIARRFRERQIADIESNLRRVAEPAPTPDERVSEKELEKEIEESDKILHQLDETEARHNSRTPQEIKSSVERELDDWQKR